MTTLNQKSAAMTRRTLRGLDGVQFGLERVKRFMRRFEKPLLLTEVAPPPPPMPANDAWR